MHPPAPQVWHDGRPATGQEWTPGHAPRPYPPGWNVSDGVGRQAPWMDEAAALAVGPPPASHHQYQGEQYVNNN